MKDLKNSTVQEGRVAFVRLISVDLPTTSHVLIARVAMNGQCVL